MRRRRSNVDADGGQVGVRSDRALVVMPVVAVTAMIMCRDCHESFVLNAISRCHWREISRAKRAKFGNLFLFFAAFAFFARDILSFGCSSVAQSLVVTFLVSPLGLLQRRVQHHAMQI